MTEATLARSTVAVASAFADMTAEERSRWRMADVPGRSPIGNRNLDIPFPFGWYPALLSSELKNGEVRPLRYFARDLVIWRSDSGTVRMLDAFCRHLGAHMGHGGRVAGEYLECPFHAWRYDGEGAVREIPYAKSVPLHVRKACDHPWPVVEANRMIWFWYHPFGAEPQWQVEEFPETSDPAWTDYEIHEWRVFSALQNMAENSVDLAHFQFVHGTPFPASEMIWDGIKRVSIIDTGMNTPRGRVASRIEAKMIGPGQSATRFTGLAETLLVAAITPVEKDEVRVRFCFTQPKAQNEGISSMAAKAFIHEVCRQLDQDKIIWDRMRYLERPIVCDGDGPILRFRKYYNQFYAEWVKEPSAKSTA